MKKTYPLFLALILLFIFAGCSSEADYAPPEAAEEAVEYSVDEMTGEMGFDDSLVDTAETDTVVTDRMIIKNANLDLGTNNYDESLAGIRAKIEELGGEVTHSDQWGSEEEIDRHISMTVRIPAENYQPFLDGVASLAEVYNMNESTEDVTTQYIDIEARIESLEAQEDRLLELLDIAETVTEIIEIESQLASVRYERESYTAQRLYLERQVSMSTVYLALHEEEVIIVTETGFFATLAESFINGFFGVGDFLEGFAIVFVGSIPGLVLLGGFVVIIVVIIKKIRSKRKK